MADKDEILRRMERAEKEDQRLQQELEKAGKSRSGATKPDHVTVSESEYLGHPVITFSIGKRSSSMGLRRLAAVRAARLSTWILPYDTMLCYWNGRPNTVGFPQRTKTPVKRET